MDIQKIETKDKLCIKEPDEVTKDEEFNHVETSYRRLREIMLYKKFDSIYNERANANVKD